MATLQELEAAFIKADDAGETEDARAFAAEIRRMRAAQAPAQQQPSSDQSSATGTFWQNVGAGIGKSFVDTGRGLKQLIDIPAQALERAVDGGRLSRALGMPTAAESAAGTQADVDEAKRLDAALMRTGGGITGNIAGQTVQWALPATKLAKAAPLATAATTVGKVAPRAAQYVAPAVTGAAIGAAQPIATGDSRGEQAAYGALGGAAGQAVASGIGRLASGASSSISPEVAKLARAAEARGIPLTADQLVNSKPLNALRSALEYVPFSGSGAGREAQGKAFNRAISRTVGENTDNLTAALSSAEKRLSSEFDSVLKNNQLNINQSVLGKLQTVRADAAKEMSDAQLRPVANQIDEILAKMDPNGVVDGQAAYNIKKTLDRLAKSNDSTVAHWSKEVRGTLMDALNDSLGPQGAKAFAKTREQWGNLRELQKMVTAGAEGGISPARLAQNRNIRSDDLSEIRDIGAQFLKQRMGDSGTAQRLGYMSMIPAGFIDPVTTVGVGVGGATVGRATNALLASRPVTNYLMYGAPRLGAVSQSMNALLPLTGAALPNALQ